MPVEKKSLSPDDLVLHLNEKASSYDISQYEDFLFELCGDWDFQKEAIRKVLRYFMSGEYQNCQELFEENYNKNDKMQFFQGKDKFIDQLPFPDKLACTVDLATGTGKTWVMYGLARIMLASGLVDRVLVLCPSKTIRYELSKKFWKFSGDSILTDALPKNSKVNIPGLIFSDQTIEEGDICIDNVHKTYDHVSSSITDSLIAKGDRTLVINDEAHHILNPGGTSKATSLEWELFLKDPRFDFKYILNFSGTPYKGNNYFNDVLFKFSIRQAINQRFIKDINYLAKDETKDQKQKWAAILQNHERLKKEYPKSKKHITIVITSKISATDKIAEDIKNFLRDNTNYPESRIEKMVLPVTSAKKHEDNREILKTVDQSENLVEWIVSVNMLTEGWDVANVFQIVPFEERAFNSKLLISQVLGRGLRIPPEYRGSDILPQVWVFNHDSWSSKISHLVMEIAEIRTLISSHVIKESPYNFDLHIINIDKDIKSERKVDQNPEIKLPETLGFKSTDTVRGQTFTEVREDRELYITADVSKQIKRYSVDEATNELWTTLYTFDMDRGTDITSRVSKDYIRELVEKELLTIGESDVSEENIQRAKSSFGVLLRPFVGVTTIEEVYSDVSIVHTHEMRSSVISESSFKNHGGLVTSNDNFENIDEEEREIIDSIKKEVQRTKQTTLDKSNYIYAKVIDDLDNECYKSPLDVTLLSHKPEREFIEQFVNNYTLYVDAWVKSKDKGFYSIPYIHRPGTHSIQKDFNPDFFIKQGNRIIVVEIKSEDDSTVKNKDKLEGATAYFNELNGKLSNYTYEFYFLQPSDFTTFFERVIVKKEKYIGGLQADLVSKSREELKGAV